MSSLLADLERWNHAGLKVALARIVEVEGSAPRLAGATMAVSSNGEVSGSLSGGCVESSVVEAALLVLEEHVSGRLVRFDAITDEDDPIGVGLTCGGVIGVFIEPMTVSLLSAFIATRDSKTGVAIVTMIEGAAFATASGVNPGATLVVKDNGESLGSLGSPDLDAALVDKALLALESGESGLVHEAGGVVAFVHGIVAAPHLVIVGAVDFTAALAKVARVLGYCVTVCDARVTFATTARFPEAHKVVVDWPHRYLDELAKSLGPRDAVCVLTHDHKYDIPALCSALATEVGYVGAMGSRQTHAERIALLVEAGISRDSLARIMAPIGLDIGAATPEEVAIAICAEIIANRHNRLDGPLMSLRDAKGPIHHTGS